MLSRGKNKKHSRTPKPTQSKYKLMKQRLQLKVKGDVLGEPSQPHGGDVIEDAQAIGSDVPPIEKDIAPDEEQGEADDVEKISKSNNFNRSSPMKIVRLCKGMTDAQRTVIRNAEFGEILGMKISKLNPDLCRYLMWCFNPNTCELDFGDRGRVPITPQSVVRVMGVPWGSNPVAYHLDVNATGLMLNMFGITDGKQPSVAAVEKELGPTYPADEIYLRKFMIYLVCSVFAPTTGINVSPRCYPSLINTESLPKLNWPKFIIDTLIQTAKAKDKKNWFKACMPYLMVKYVDSLETNAVNVPQSGTRICIWTNQMITKVVDLDTNSDGSFGNLPLKECYRNMPTMFSTRPDAVDIFIRSHVPGVHSETELAKYRGAVTEMCSVFEEGLAQFLRSLSNKDVKSVDEDLQCYQTKQDICRPKRTRARRNPKTEHPYVAEDANGIVQPCLKKRKAANESSTMGNASRKMTKEVEVEKTENFMHEEAVVQVTDARIAATIPEHTEAVVHVEDAKIRNEKESGAVVYGPIQATTPSVDPLKQLQFYGSGSQSSTDSGCGMESNLSPAVTVSIFKKKMWDGSNKGKHTELTSSGIRKKKVTFADEGLVQQVQTENGEGQVSMEHKFVSTAKNVKRTMTEAAQESPRRPITRSMTPNLPASPMKDSPARQRAVLPSRPTPSPRRQTRLATTEARSERTTPVETTGTGGEMQDQSTPSIFKSTMSRKLEMEFGSAAIQPESEEQRIRRELLASYPSFDLGFDSQPTQEETVAQKTDAMPEETIVVPSNEDSGDPLDKIYATIEMPVRTPVSIKAQQQITEETNSCTPVPQAHQTRLVKAGPAGKSPYLQFGNKPVVSKSISEMYNKICSYGGKEYHELTEDDKQKIIDYGSWFIYLWDLADSVRPTGWLSNSTCEVALHVLSKEMASQKKLVMPLRLATKLRNPNYSNDRTVKKAFQFSEKNRLDHKELLMFSVLQDLTPDLKEFTGHYYLIVLNLKARRFEVMDSMRKEGNRGLMSDVDVIVGSIKHMWKVNYSKSSIKIADFKTSYIGTPMQQTSHDCGYFVLKFIESWDGRRLLPFNPHQIAIFRKLFAKKLVEYEENKIAWQEVLFKH